MKTLGWLGTLIAALVLLAQRAPGAEYTWTQTAAGTYAWPDAANWGGSGFPSGVDDVGNLAIDMLGAQTINLNQVITLGGLKIGDAGGSYFATTVAANGGSLTLQASAGNASLAKVAPGNNVTDTISAAVTLGSNLAANIANGGLTLSGIVSGSGFGITKAGNGTLALNAANTFTGGVTLSAGTLSLGNAAALGTSAGSFTIGDGTFLNSTSSNLVLSSNNAQTWNGGFTFQGSQNLNLGTGAVTLNASPAVTVNANTLTVGGAITGSSRGLTKFGTGTLQLSSASKSTFDGGLTLRAGTLRLDFANATTPASGLVADANTLTLGGGDLTVVAKNNAASAQTLGATTINTGRSVVTVNGTGSGTMNLTTGAWTRNTGGTVNVVLGTGGTLTASPAVSNGIIGPWATFNSGANTRYATVSAGTIASYASATGAATAADLTDTTGTVNYDLTTATGTMPASMAANTIRYAGGAATTAPGATLFSVNGLLHVGSGTWTIGTNALTIGASRELVVNAANNQITISGIVKDYFDGSASLASTLVKDGTSTLALTGANTHSGGTVLNAGQINLGNNAALGGGTFTINGGSIGDNGTTFTSSTNPAIVINGNFSKPDTAGRTINLGNGAVTLNRPVVITSGGHPFQIGGTVTGPGGLNAFDITPNGSNNAAVILSANITLRGNQIVTTQGNAGSLQVDGVISEAAAGYGFTVDGSGSTGGVTLQNNVTHTFTGPVVLQNSGGLTVRGNISPSSLTIYSGSTLTLGNADLATTGTISGATTFLNNGTFRVGQNRDLTQGTHFPSLITGSGRLTTGNHGTSVLNAQNTYAGGTVIGGSSGTYTIQLAANAVGSVGSITSGPIGTGPVTFGTGGGGAAMSSDGTTPRTIFNPITITTSTTLGNSTRSGKLTFEAPVTLSGVRTISTPSAVDFTGTVGGAGGGFTKTGAGTLSLAAGNTFTGGVTLGDAANNNEGILNIAADSSLGTGTLSFNNGRLQFATGSTVALAAGRTVVLNASRTGRIDTSLAAGSVDSVISGSGNLEKLGANALTLNAENAYTGTTTVSGGSVRLGVAKALQFSGFVTTGSNASGGVGLDVNGLTTLMLGGLSGSVNLANAVIGYSGLTGLTLSPLSGSLTYSGEIADGFSPLAITKAGGGTQVLSGTSTYTGTTTVNAGLLQVTGALAAGSAVTVNGGAIGGSGNGTTTGLIGGSVTLAGTGGVDLRNAAIGNLTVGGDLAITGAAGANRLIFDLGSAAGGVDKLVVGGTTTMTTAGAAVIAVNPTSTTRVNNGTYTLIQGTGSVPSAGSFVLPTTKAFGLDLALSVSGNELQLTTAQLASGPAAPGWTGAADTAWTNASNWSTGAPSYQSNVTLYSTAANLNTTLGADFNVNSLSFPAGATSAVTVGGSNMLTIEATNANSNSSGNGITVATPSSGTPVHTISANVGLAANQTWTVNTGGTLTVSGGMTDFGLGRRFAKEGEGTLNLNGATQVGSLWVGYGENKRAGSVVLGSGSSLSVGTGGGSEMYVGVGTGTSNTNVTNGVLDASAAASVVVNVGTLKVGGTVGSTGTLRLGASNTITASTLFGICQGDWGFPNGFGTVTTPANSTTAIVTPLMYVGYNIPNGSTGGWGRFYSGSGSSVTINAADGGRTALSIGVIGGWNGASESMPSEMNLAGSDGTASADLRLSSLLVGQLQGGSNQAHGTMTFGTSALNRLDVSGPGTVVTISDSNATGTVSGTLTIGHAGTASSIASTSGGTAVLLASRRNAGNVTGSLNLVGGTLAVATSGTGIGGGGGTSNLNMIGGTLKAGASTNSFISGLTNARMYAGGLTVDTDGKSITIPQSLVAAPATSTATSYGLEVMTVITPTAGGSGYTTPPSVSFNTPSGGTPATGVAQINTAGQVTGIVITNPGSGYSNGATVTISPSGGGGTGATFTNPTATVFQGNGGLTKTGLGTLSLSGTNTYAGPTMVTGGTLAVVDAGSINSSGLTLDGGHLRYDSSVAYSGAFTFTRGSIGGTNLTGNLGGLIIGTDRTLSPGMSPGIAATTSQIWDAGGTYLWEINDPVGDAGDSEFGWDLLTGTGSLTILADSTDRFTVAIRSLNPANAPGFLFGFDPAQDYAWKIADFANPISTFSADAFTVNTSGFVDSFNGSFSVALGTSVTGGTNNQLYMVYTVPEPGTVGLIAAAVGLALALRRRR